MCFNCKEWGYIGEACPEKHIYRVIVVSDDACYAMGRLDGQLDVHKLTTVLQSH